MMKKISKEELSEIFSVVIEEDVQDICLDSRCAKVGDLFIALKGNNADGHDFVNQALTRGAILAVVERDVALQNPDFKKRLIYVSSSYDALKKLSEKRVKKSEASFIGVTGSVGKTTTKNMLYHLFSHLENFGSKTYMSQKNFNTQIGLPVCLSLMPSDTKVGIFEYGVGRKGDMKDLINILEPDVSVITNIGHAHLEFFSSELDVAKEKSRIFKTHKQQKAAIIPADSGFFEFLKSKAQNIKNIYSFGYRKNSSARILDVEESNNYIKIKADIVGKIVAFELKLINYSFVENAIASILACHVVSNEDPKLLASLIENFATIDARSEIKFLRDITLINDSYNASPESMRSALISLGKFKSLGRKVAVLGDMLELGRESRYFHENLAATIDKFNIDLVFLCGEMMKYLFENLIDSKKAAWQENSELLLRDVMSQITSGDVILVKGSNGMHMNLISSMIYEHFKG